jgi:alcohol dehydrogenase (NADP+)
MTMNVLGYAASSAKAALEPYRFERRDPRADDIVIEILYCGICHSDVHQVRDDWNNTTYPVVPGHEIIGRVVDVGKMSLATNQGIMLVLVVWLIHASTVQPASKG